MTERQRWAEERLVSYLLDALPEDQTGEVESILSELEEYQEILKGREPEDVGHIPAALLARWQKAGLQVHGVERVLVLQHLGCCSNCREELRLVGGSVQEWVDASESAPRETMGHPPLDSQSRVSTSPSWTAWFGGAALGIAAGILLMLVLPDRDSHQDGLHGVAVPVVVPQNLRSNRGSEIQITDPQAPLLLAMVIPRLEENLDAELTVRDPNGWILSQTAVRVGPAAERTIQVILQPESGWTDGTHTIELVVVGETEARDLGSFELDLTP